MQRETAINYLSELRKEMDKVERRLDYFEDKLHTVEWNTIEMKKHLENNRYR